MRHSSKSSKDARAAGFIPAVRPAAIKAAARPYLSVLGLAFLAILGGCTDTPTPEQMEATPPALTVLGDDFDEAATGTLSGTVTWRGDVPQAAPFKAFGLPGDYSIDVRQEQPNPNLPRIQQSTLALEGVVVFLREVNLNKSRPWDHPRVRVEQRDRRLVIWQGESSSNVGWVRAGDTIEVINNDDHFHMLRGRGAAFFSLPFAQPKVPSRRRLDNAGLIELSSGAFFFWMHGYLLVDNHPYYTRTDARGQFTLEKVPAGLYDLVCWMPSWEVTKRIRDPETGHVIQVDFQQPVEHVQKVAVTAGQRHETSFTWSSLDFPPAGKTAKTPAN
jgi:hypothetical protein